MANEFYMTFGSGEPNSCIVFHDGNEPPTLVANTVTLWAEDVGSAGHELKVKDENGNITILSSNVEAYPDDMAVSDTYPHVTLLQNEFIGVGTYISTIRQAELVQELAKKEGLLKEDEFIIKHVDIPQKDWAAAEQWRFEQREREVTSTLARKASMKTELNNARDIAADLLVHPVPAPIGIIPNDPDQLEQRNKAKTEYIQYAKKVDSTQDQIHRLEQDIAAVKIPKQYTKRPKPAWLKGKDK